MNAFLKIALLFFILSLNPVYGQGSPTAKYIILMISDGWGAKHIEATNKYTETAPSYQSDPTWTRYYMSTFPIGGSYNTAQAWTDFDYVLQGEITDSAASATALYSSNKTENRRISVSADRDRLFTIGEQARNSGKAVGAVSTVPVSHATPGAWTSHNDSRGNRYAIADEAYFEDPNTTGQPSESRYGGGYGTTIPSTDVIIGDGRSGYVNAAIRNKLASESGQPGKHFLVERENGKDGGNALIAAAQDSSNAKLAGLFDHVYHRADDSGYDPENPINRLPR